MIKVKWLKLHTIQFWIQTSLFIGLFTWKKTLFYIAKRIVKKYKNKIKTVKENGEWIICSACHFWIMSIVGFISIKQCLLLNCNKIKKRNIYIWGMKISNRHTNITWILIVPYRQYIVDRVCFHLGMFHLDNIPPVITT